MYVCIKQIKEIHQFILFVLACLYFVERFIKMILFRSLGFVHVVVTFEVVLYSLCFR